jgi:hypothetical protein
VPADVKVHDSVELPGAVTLVGLRVHEVLLLTRLTVPANPPTEPMLIAEVAAVPALTVMLVGLAVIVKSGAVVKVTTTEWDSVVLLPVTSTWNVPDAVNVHDSVEDPEPVTLVGDNVHEVLLETRLTTPAKPFWPVTVMLEVAATFGVKLTLNGVAMMVKSWTV